MKTIIKQQSKTGLFFLFRFLLFVLVCLIEPINGQTALIQGELQVDFLYDTQAITGKTFAGYRLYENDNLVCQTGAIDLQSINCMVSYPVGHYSFTLSAYYVDGYETPQSAPFNATIVDVSSAIEGLQILAGLSPTDVGDLGTFAGTNIVELADVIEVLRLTVTL